jgi:hypothetical protein
MSGGFAAKRDLFGGALMVAIGLGSVLEGRNHTIGTLTNMGSGYFPIILGVVLAGLGVAIALTGLSPGAVDDAEDGQAGFQLPDWRGASAIIASIVAFIFLGDRFGLAPATFVCVFIAALGDRQSKLFEAFLLATALTAVAIGLFVYLLQIPFPIFHWDPA